MPFEAAERAKEHFATKEPLKVKDKDLKVSDARYVESFLFVGNLNDDVEPEHLHTLFQAHGQTERAIVRSFFFFCCCCFLSFPSRFMITFCILCIRVTDSSHNDPCVGYAKLKNRQKEGIRIC